MNKITYRKAIPEDCYNLAVLKRIGLLYILKEYQRQGIGKSFFDIARKQVAANGYTEFFLSVNSKNFAAQKFYLAMAGMVVFEDETQIKFQYVV